MSLVQYMRDSERFVALRCDLCESDVVTFTDEEYRRDMRALLDGVRDFNIHVVESHPDDPFYGRIRIVS